MRMVQLSTEPPSQRRHQKSIPILGCNVLQMCGWNSMCPLYRCTSWRDARVVAWVPVECALIPMGGGEDGSQIDRVECSWYPLGNSLSRDDMTSDPIQYHDEQSWDFLHWTSREWSLQSSADVCSFGTNTGKWMNWWRWNFKTTLGINLRCTSKETFSLWTQYNESVPS